MDCIKNCFKLFEDESRFFLVFVARRVSEIRSHI